MGEAKRRKKLDPNYGVVSSQIAYSPEAEVIVLEYDPESGLYLFDNLTFKEIILEKAKEFGRLTETKPFLDIWDEDHLDEAPDWAKELRWIQATCEADLEIGEKYVGKFAQPYGKFGEGQNARFLITNL